MLTSGPRMLLLAMSWSMVLLQVGPVSVTTGHLKVVVPVTHSDKFNYNPDTTPGI